MIVLYRGQHHTVTRIAAWAALERFPEQFFAVLPEYFENCDAAGVIRVPLIGNISVCPDSEIRELRCVFADRNSWSKRVRKVEQHALNADRLDKEMLRSSSVALQHVNPVCAWRSDQRDGMMR